MSCCSGGGGHAPLPPTCAADCPAGTYGPSCSPCPPGSWCPGGSPGSEDAPIHLCGDNKYSNANAQSEGDCFCAPGGPRAVSPCMTSAGSGEFERTVVFSTTPCYASSAGTGGPTCQRCQEGTWSAGGNLQPCQACGPGLTSQAGAPSAAYCGCYPGFGRDPNNPESCAACSAGTWSAGPPASVANGLAPSILPCTQCAAGRTGPQGATSPAHCYCAPGTCGTVAAMYVSCSPITLTPSPAVFDPSPLGSTTDAACQKPLHSAMWRTILLAHRHPPSQCSS